MQLDVLGFKKDSKQTSGFYLNKSKADIFIFVLLVLQLEILPIPCCPSECNCSQ